ncbi:dienelactone hydrolase family protein [Streptosporangium sp. NPDC006007]|uniref:dienelactone hydrolase family protein n=1 Tax=Streptosporangium sp. NPDC006007 TaxID=3154575 RepID=UPI0033B49BFC
MNAVRMNLEHLEIPVAGVTLGADVVVPRPAHGAVLFAHGSGSSRHSPRNRYVAGELHRAGLATILTDLLTPAEEQADFRTGELRFDIGLLTVRLAALTGWLVAHEPTAGLYVGLFGASTGAAAALAAAATRPDAVKAVVSRGGRPDLAGDALRSVHQPTLLIVGEADPAVVKLNREAARELRGETRLEIVPGASHLFEEPGALERVAYLAREWFLRHLSRAPDGGREGPS